MAIDDIWSQFYILYIIIIQNCLLYNISNIDKIAALIVVQEKCSCK